jgi:hypothetical protein
MVRFPDYLGTILNMSFWGCIMGIPLDSCKMGQTYLKFAFSVVLFRNHDAQGKSSHLGTMPEKIKP